MYVDPSETDSMKTTEKDDVKEATEALKGLLGLTTTTPTATEVVVDPVTVTGTTQPQQVPQEEQLPAKPKKNKKKKKKKAAGGNNNGETTTEATTTTRNNNTPPKPKNKKGGKQKTRKPKVKQENENYAWSAFQSSPDASKLPIPAFSPPPTEKQVMQVSNTESTTPLTETESEEKTPSVKTEKTVEEDGPPEQSSSPTSNLPSVNDPPRQPEFLGETGVNLAALAAEKETPPFPPSYPPQQHFYPHSMPPPPPPPPPGPYAPPPPGYVTIQLQLPMVLPPDRTIIVQGPSGYPVSVRVPENYLPGTIIPVNVPTGPPMMYSYPPPH